MSQIPRPARKAGASARSRRLDRMMMNTEVTRWRRHAVKLRILAVMLENAELACLAQDCEAHADEIETPRGHTAERWRGAGARDVAAAR